MDGANDTHISLSKYWNDTPTQNRVIQVGAVNNEQGCDKANDGRGVLRIEEETKQYQQKLIQNARNAYNISANGTHCCTDVDEFILDSIMDDWSTSDDCQESANVCSTTTLLATTNH